METTPLTQSMGDAAYQHLVSTEGRGNFIYGDSKGIPTVGAGIALVVGSDSRWTPLGTTQLNALFQSMGKTVPEGLAIH
jgi:hypothetical protein